jgi:hypothetical protein
VRTRDVKRNGIEKMRCTAKDPASVSSAYAETRAFNYFYTLHERRQNKINNRPAGERGARARAGASEREFYILYEARARMLKAMHA